MKTSTTTKPHLGSTVSALLEFCDENVTEFRLRDVLLAAELMHAETRDRLRLSLERIRELEQLAESNED